MIRARLLSQHIILVNLVRRECLSTEHMGALSRAKRVWLLNIKTDHSWHVLDIQIHILLRSDEGTWLSHGSLLSVIWCHKHAPNFLVLLAITIRLLMIDVTCLLTTLIFLGLLLTAAFRVPDDAE